ncbi:MAG: hypothetical protein [Caudoviricetes sp.]|nr:MAG: hypothetical protein [Caudoviricetes sp.]
MNSAIGNYVHYHKNNYESWGINQRNTVPSENWNVAASEFKNKLLEINDINKLIRETSELEQKYNDFFYPSNKSNKEIKNFREAIKKVIQERLNEQFGLAAGSFNFSDLTVKETELNRKLSDAIRKTKESIGEVELRTVKTANDLLERVQLLYRILESNEFKNIKQAKTRINQAKRELGTIENTLINQINNNRGKKLKINKKSDEIETVKGFIKEFNRVGSIGNQNGIIFEWLLPFIQFQSSTLAKEELRKSLMELTNNKSVQLGDTKITIDIPDLQNNKLTDIDIITNNIKMKTFSTTSKTDVVISYTDSDNQLKEKAVSAKNMYNLEAHLVNKTSLYNILLLSNSYNFATHYLNVVTVAQGERSGPERIIEANRLLKGLILKFAAEGYDSNNSSELLIVNHQSSKHIYVYNIKVLIYLIQNNIVNNNGKYANAVVDFRDDFTIPQTFDKDSKDKRILKVIQSTMRNKIDVKLNTDMLESYSLLLRGNLTT